MATIRMRKGKWQAQISFKGRQKAKSFTNRDHAKAWVAGQNRLIRHTPERVFALVPLVELTGLAI
jgi:hypothetical protein